MPRSFLFTREQIVQAALELTREGGIDAVTARALGARLGTSTKPIFGLFRSMEEVQHEVLTAADAVYHDYLRAHMAQGNYPPYKASGMAYIRFAKEERELFKLLFMRDRTGEMPAEDPQLEEIYRLISEKTGLSAEAARALHLEMWVFVHGFATMVATSYLDWFAWDEALISRALTDAYRGLICRFLEGSERGKE